MNVADQVLEGCPNAESHAKGEEVYSYERIQNVCPRPSSNPPTQVRIHLKSSVNPSPRSSGKLIQD